MSLYPLCCDFRPVAQFSPYEATGQLRNIEKYNSKIVLTLSQGTSLMKVYSKDSCLKFQLSAFLRSFVVSKESRIQIIQKNSKCISAKPASQHFSGREGRCCGWHLIRSTFSWKTVPVYAIVQNFSSLTLLQKIEYNIKINDSCVHQILFYKMKCH